MYGCFFLFLLKRQRTSTVKWTSAGVISLCLSLSYSLCHSALSAPIDQIESYRWHTQHISIVLRPSSEQLVHSQSTPPLINCYFHNTLKFFGIKFGFNREKSKRNHGLRQFEDVGRIARWSWRIEGHGKYITRVFDWPFLFARVFSTEIPNDTV